MRVTLIFLFALLMMPAAVLAQTNCDEGTGPLNNAQPQGTTPQQIIEKFGAKEEIFRQALNNYVYTQDITVQELDGNSVSGEFRLVQEITYDDKGGRIENVTFAPQNTLRQLSLSREDYEDFRYKMAFVLTTLTCPSTTCFTLGSSTRTKSIPTFSISHPKRL